MKVTDKSHTNDLLELTPSLNLFFCELNFLDADYRNKYPSLFILNKDECLPVALTLILSFCFICTIPNNSNAADLGKQIFHIFYLLHLHVRENTLKSINSARFLHFKCVVFPIVVFSFNNIFCCRNWFPYQIISSLFFPHYLIHSYKNTNIIKTITILNLETHIHR